MPGRGQSAVHADIAGPASAPDSDKLLECRLSKCTEDRIDGIVHHTRKSMSAVELDRRLERPGTLDH